MFINIEIEGITPLIRNRFTDEAAETASNGTSQRGSSRQQRNAAGDRREETLSRSRRHHLHTAAEHPAFHRRRRNFHKAGKKQITTKSRACSTLVVDIEGVALPLIHKQPWQVDTRPIVIPSTGGRIRSHRPMFDDWRLAFTVDLDTSTNNCQLHAPSSMTRGKKCAPGRPPSQAGTCRYGKYVVVRWDVEAKSQ